MANAALLLFVPVSVVLFSLRRSPVVIVSTIYAGWLLLPETTLGLPGLPDLKKDVVVAVALILAVGMFDRSSLSDIRLRAIDAPVIVWVLVSGASSLTNDLGVWNALSEITERALTWGVPWFIGRWYLAGAANLRRLAWALPISLLAYVPFIAAELRLSPQLHRWVYGEHVFKFLQSQRFGAYRATVFLSHGLELGLFAAIASVTGIWLVMNRRIDRPFGIPNWLLVLGFLATSAATLSVNAWGLTLLGLGLIVVGRRLPSPVLMMPIGAAWAYAVFRISGMSFDWIVDLARSTINANRAQSLEFRHQSEEILIRRALQKPWFGWGGFNRAVPTPTTGPPFAPDSLWVLILGRNGLVGVLAVWLTISIPPIAFLRRHPPKTWLHPAVLPTVPLAIGLTLIVVNSTLNAHIPLAFVVIAGALSSAAINKHPLDVEPVFHLQPVRLSKQEEWNVGFVALALTAVPLTTAMLQGDVPWSNVVAPLVFLAAVLVVWMRVRWRIDRTVDSEARDEVQAAETASGPSPLGIAILNYRTRALTVACLESIAADRAQYPSVQVLVLDNASGDISVPGLRAKIYQRGWTEWVTVVASETNLGFAGGMNRAVGLLFDDPTIQEVLLLNSDTELRPGALAALANHAAADSQAGVITARMTSPEGDPQPVWFGYPTPSTEFLRAANTGVFNRLLRRPPSPLILPEESSVGKTWVPLAGALVRRDVFDDVGWLDDGFFMYFEDIDFCRRAQDANWSLGVCDDAEIVHLVGGSSAVQSAESRQTRRPRYYYEARSRYFTNSGGRRHLVGANAAWHAGRTVSLLRETVGLAESSATCPEEWRDIWTGWWRRPDVSVRQ